jgi:ATP-dependent Lon protease
MARTCTICNHDKRIEIDKALLEGTPVRHIAAQYGTSTGTLQRHKSHLTGTMAKSEHAKEITRAADDLVGKLVDLQTETHEVLETAKSQGNLNMILQAVGKASQLIETQAKIAGQIKESQTININMNPQFVQIKENLMNFAERHPEHVEELTEVIEDAAG